VIWTTGKKTVCYHIDVPVDFRGGPSASSSSMAMRRYPRAAMPCPLSAADREERITRPASRQGARGEVCDARSLDR
jgi:hypothetical protein